MSRRRRRSKPIPSLAVMFDTSVIHTASFEQVISPEAAQLITQNSRLPELAISWHLPEIVLKERRHQLLAKALDLFGPFQKLETFFDANYGVTVDTIAARLDQWAADQLSSLGIRVISLDHTTVDWPRLIQDSADRRPPFSPGEKEKGFRDAIIAETYIQFLLTQSRYEGTRVVLVTADKLLAQAVEARTHGFPAVQPPLSLEDLKSLIAALLSAASEQFIAQVAPLATEFFFHPGQRASLFYAEDVKGAIQHQFRSGLAELPQGTWRRVNGPWFVAPSSFVKRENGRYHWSNRITIQQRAFGFPSAAVTPPAFSGFTSQLDTDFDGSTGTFALPSSFDSDVPPALGMPPSGGTSVIDSDDLPLFAPVSPEGRFTPFLGGDAPWRSGLSVFEVIWSVTVSTRRKLKDPKIESLQFVSSTWE